MAHMEQMMHSLSLSLSAVHPFDSYPHSQPHIQPQSLYPVVRYFDAIEPERVPEAEAIADSVRPSPASSRRSRSRSRSPKVKVNPFRVTRRRSDGSLNEEGRRHRRAHSATDNDNDAVYSLQCGKRNGGLIIHKKKCARTKKFEPIELNGLHSRSTRRNDDDVLHLEDKANATDKRERSRSESNMSSQFDADALSDGARSSFIDLFDLEQRDVTDDSDCAMDGDVSVYKIAVPHISIPRTERDLLKKVKPAYLHHLEMVDDDGSIRRSLEQRKRRREREREKGRLMTSTRRSDAKAPRTSLVLHFASKPLGFQINESPDSIFVTNVYDDRGSAHAMGVRKGWKIAAVNGHSKVKRMMDALRNSQGPFEITFET